MKTTPKKNSKPPVDLPDTKDDKEHLQPDEATLDLPDVKDIPGQEHVRPLVTGEISDTTISSSDEEGHTILDTDGDADEIITDKSSNVSKIERDLLQQSSESTITNDDEQLKNAAVDNADEDNTALNEKTNLSGDDLDVPGSEDDDDNEDIGAEDEENNYYSRRDPDEG